MRKFLFAIVLLLAVYFLLTRFTEVEQIALGAEGAPPLGGLGPESWVIPAAAHAPGLAGTRWLTDAVLHNPGTAAVMANIYFLRSGTDWLRRNNPASTPSRQLAIAGSVLSSPSGSQVLSHFFPGRYF